MNLQETDYQILRLTNKFYSAYPNPPYREIMDKPQRAYNCLLFQSRYDYFICVPYRSEIKHKYSFRFKNSVRSKKHKSGLDYTKTVIIVDKDYIDSKDALVDKDEFNETMINLSKIQKEVFEFVEDYVEHMRGQKKLHSKEFHRRYNYSPLKYFHKELGI